MEKPQGLGWHSLSQCPWMLRCKCCQQRKRNICINTCTRLLLLQSKRCLASLSGPPRSLILHHLMCSAIDIKAPGVKSQKLQKPHQLNGCSVILSHWSLWSFVYRSSTAAVETLVSSFTHLYTEFFVQRESTSNFTRYRKWIFCHFPGSFHTKIDLDLFPASVFIFHYFIIVEQNSNGHLSGNLGLQHSSDTGSLSITCCCQHTN